MRRGLAALASQQRVPDIGEGFELLEPDSDLTFVSDAWTISLDPSTGRYTSCTPEEVPACSFPQAEASVQRGQQVVHAAGWSCKADPLPIF